MFFLLASFREHAKLRVFHHITFLIVLVAALAYFAMSQGLGFVDVEVGDGTYRSLAWARYADWTIVSIVYLALSTVPCTRDWSREAQTSYRRCGGQDG